MKRIRMTLGVIAVLSLTLAAGGKGSGGSGRDLIGLWQGVDPNDGSLRTVSITDRDDDGLFETAARDSYWTLCGDDRAIEVSAGTVGDDGELRTEGIVTCFVEGSEIEVGQTYEYDRREDTLRATPDVTTLLPITLHRVSR